MSDYTPGPWEVKCNRCNSSITGYQIVGPDCKNIGAVFRRLDNHPEKAEQEVTANANLIAAAPDLLEALEYIVREFDKEGKQNHITAKARFAITRAKGELK